MRTTAGVLAIMLLALLGVGCATISAPPSASGRENVSFRVVVNRDLSSSEVLKLAYKGRMRTFFKGEEKWIPANGSGIEEVEVVFFRLGRVISIKELAEEYRNRGLRPDPYAQIACNVAQPTFAGVWGHPNVCQWWDAFYGWRYIIFGQMVDSRMLYVSVGQCKENQKWGKGWWFCGVRVADQQ